MKKQRKFTRDVATQIMYQLELRGTSDYAKLLSHYIELCRDGGYEELHATFMEGFKNRDYAYEAAADERFAPAKCYGAIGADSLDTEYLNELFARFAENKTGVDEAIKVNLRRWKFERVALIDLAILRVAITEIFYMADISAKTSVDEAVELAKLYGEDKSPQFVNGLLANYVDK